MSWPTTIGSLPLAWFPPVHDADVGDATVRSYSQRELGGVVLARNDSGGRDQRSLSVSWELDAPAAAVFLEHRRRYAGSIFPLRLPGESADRMVRWAGPVQVSWRSNVFVRVSAAVELASPLTA